MNEKGSNKLKPETMMVMLFLNKPEHYIYIIFVINNHRYPAIYSAGITHMTGHVLIF